MSANDNRVVAACEKHWETYKDDCSGFVKAVANELGVVLIGSANDIVDRIQNKPWTALTSGIEAKDKAETALVIAGLKATPNGHVAIVVPGELAHGKYPTGYWGHLGSVGRKNATLNWSWNAADRDKVIYSWCLY